MTCAPGFNSLPSADGIKVADLKSERVFWIILLGLIESESFRGRRESRKTCWKGEA